MQYDFDGQLHEPIIENKCHICGAASDVCETCDDGEQFHCEDCQYMVCEKCGTGTHNITDLIYHDDKYLCEECSDYEYPVCYSCAERTPTNYTLTSETYDVFCEICYHEIFTWCENCDREILCEDSYDGRCSDCQTGGHDYGYKPFPRFHGKGNVYMGVELEVDDGPSVDTLIDELTAIDPNENDFYLKHDGSLNDGIEIVSHPATIQAHLKEMPWKSILKTAKSEGFKSHYTGTCGLHVHVNRDGLGRYLTQQENTIDKLIVMFWKLDRQLFKFSRRSPGTFNHWSPFNHDETEDFKPTKAKYAKSGNRYRAINTTNAATIEFRLFRGTLKLETFIATLQLVDVLVQMAQNYSLAYIIRRLRWADIVNYNPNYKALRDYSAQRGLPCV